MGVGRGIHYFGSFLLLTATVLLIVASVSAPVANSISILTVYIDSAVSTQMDSTLTFGTFGYCVMRSGTTCTGSHIGYEASKAVDALLPGANFDKYAAATADGLTRVMVLHPVCAGLAFITFLISLPTGIVGGILTTLAALVAFVVTLAVLVTDFVGFAIIKNYVNDAPGNSSSVWGSAMWLVLVATLCLFFGWILTFITCCADRRRRKRESVVVKEHGHGDGYGRPVHRRRFWQRR